MNTCSFTYVPLRTLLPSRATGVERTWDYLKREFDRNSDGLPNAKYYETIGPGPQLFAAIEDKVYYHHDNRWVQYVSASHVTYGTIPMGE